MKKTRNLSIFGILCVSTFIALILSIVALATKVGGEGEISLFDSKKWSEIPAGSFLSHRNVTIALGIVALIVSILILLVIAFFIFREMNNDQTVVVVIIAIIFISLLVLIFASIAVKFNIDLNSKAWVIKHFPFPQEQVKPYENN